MGTFKLTGDATIEDVLQWVDSIISVALLSFLWEPGNFKVIGSNRRKKKTLLKIDFKTRFLIMFFLFPEPI
jgi:hypothetical protein